MAKLEDLERRVHKSEKRKRSKLPPPTSPTKAVAAETLAKRAAASELRDAQLETELTAIPVPPGARSCPVCASGDLRSVGAGKLSSIIEYVRPHFRRRVFQRETLSCRCGHIITAPAPDRVGDKTRYAPSFVAHLVVCKCNDSIPLYRLEKGYRRLGIPVSRSTMCDLFHRAATELRPLYTAALALVAQAPDVHADETSIRQQGLAKRAFLWTFVTSQLVVYRYAPTRSGATAKMVLGDSTGRLVVDQYTGYNAVTKPGNRARAGCLAHARVRVITSSPRGEHRAGDAFYGTITSPRRGADTPALVHVLKLTRRTVQLEICDRGADESA